MDPSCRTDRSAPRLGGDRVPHQRRSTSKEKWEQLGIPVVSVPQAEAADHFGWLNFAVAADNPTSAQLTRAELGWTPAHPGLLDAPTSPGSPRTCSARRWPPGSTGPGCPPRRIADHLGRIRLSLTQDVYMGRGLTNPEAAAVLDRPR